jgi:hypothetical protein
LGNRGENDGQREVPPHRSALTFGSHFGPKATKIPAEKTRRKQSPKNMVFDSKRVPEWSQKRARELTFGLFFGKSDFTEKCTPPRQEHDFQGSGGAEKGKITIRNQATNMFKTWMQKTCKSITKSNKGDTQISKKTSKHRAKARA